MRYETRALDYDGPFNLLFSFGPIVRGRSDPTSKIGRTDLFRASRTPDGPATIHAAIERADGEGGRVVAEAWGEGGPWLLERLDELLGLHTPAWTVPAGGALGDLPRRATGLRLPKTHRVLELLVPVVLEQLVTGKESKRAFRGLVKNFSEPAPGPGLGLTLPLSPEALRTLPPMSFLPLGVHPDHGKILRDLGWRAGRLEALMDVSHAEAYEKLTSLPGIGPWTAGLSMSLGFGDPDALAVGDYHLKNIVAYNLAGEERATDERMLELLEPWRGKRGVVARVLMAYGKSPPRRGPRMSVREPEDAWIPTRRRK
jgi:3-methyladenine DNA glycosylase/8-oxoguanine DNA glycosylase